MGKLDGKVAIITGSSNGIGRATAVLFAKKGASVTIHGRNPESLKETENLIKLKGIPENRINFVRGSLEDEKTCHDLIEKTVEKFGKIDILINNAALGDKNGIDRHSIENYQYVFDVNLKAVILTTQLAIPYLEKTKGNVVNVSSVSGIRAFPVYTYYSMSKAALDHFCRCYALILAEKGIRVNNLNPGPITTDIQNKSDLSKGVIDGFQQYMIANTAMHRYGTVEEMAKTLLFMTTDATYMTGSIVVADGGHMLYYPLPKME